MPDRATKMSPLVYARVAGFLYLIIILLGISSELFVRQSLVVAGDAGATAANILASEGLFRLGFVGDTIVFLCDVALAVLFYVLFKPVSQTLSLMAAAFRLTQAAIVGASLLLHQAALLLLNGGVLGGAFSPDQLHALALLSIKLHGHGYDLGLLFFGVNSLIVGYLLVRAAFFPTALGFLVIAAGCVYLAGSYVLFLVPVYAEAFAPAYIIPVVAESAFCLWLLIKGLNMSAWEGRET